MRASELHDIRDIRVREDVERPTVGPGDIRMKVEAATTCGTDLKMSRRDYPGVELPLVPWGHESAGVVEEVGERVEGFAKGDKIAAHNTAPCFSCYHCKREEYELCENLTQRWGAYAEYALIPAPIVEVNTFKIPNHVSFAEASVLEPFASTVHGAAEAGIDVGHKVAIIGAGFQGLSYVQLAQLYGASQITSVDLIDYRLDLARELGATDVINAEENDLARRAREVTNGKGYDIVIEAAGTPKTWENALDIARKGGTVLEYGGCEPGTSITVDTERLHYDELNIKGVYHTTPRYVQRAWDLIVGGDVDMKPLLSKEMKLKEIEQAYEILEKGEDAIKIAIKPQL